MATSCLLPGHPLALLTTDCSESGKTLPNCTLEPKLRSAWALPEHRRWDDSTWAGGTSRPAGFCKGNSAHLPSEREPCKGSASTGSIRSKSPVPAPFEGTPPASHPANAVSYLPRGRRSLCVGPSPGPHESQQGGTCWGVPQMASVTGSGLGWLYYIYFLTTNVKGLQIVKSILHGYNQL